MYPYTQIKLGFLIVLRTKKRRISTGKLSDMEVEARGIERQIIGVTIGGFEVTSGIEFRIVPEAATEIGKKREFRP